jgi:hypothetical protein
VRLAAIPLIILLALAGPLNCAPEHVETTDFAVVNDAFLHGYTHNRVTDVIDGTSYPTLSIGCVVGKTHIPDADNEARWFSAWTRDLYWGGLGWIQAGDEQVLDRTKTTIRALIACKNRNKADGHVKGWPLNNGRYYIPQAWCKGGAIAEDFFPYCSESQADFLLLTHLYWKVSGDKAFIEEIWDDIVYVTKNIEVMDTNGNSLPDNLWGSYDYQGLGQDSEEPLMSAKASAAYAAVAEMAKAIGKRDDSRRLSALAEQVRKAMNKPISQGGLWKAGGGYYVNRRGIKKGEEGVDETFIPYENLVPIFFGMTSKAQSKAIFDRLDKDFDKFYPLKWGPMYIAPAGHNEKSVLDCSTTPWLGFLDVYLRCKHGREKNRSEIFGLLIEHAYDVPAAPFTEGAGIDGSLTGGSGRLWDNGNFFHCLVSGVYGIEKQAEAIHVTSPTRMTGFRLTQLRNVHWRDAEYDFRWEGTGSRISELMLDSVRQSPTISGEYLLSSKTGRHIVTITLAY